MSSLKNIINIMKSRFNFLKVNKTDSCLNFLKVNKTDFYLNFFKVITVNSFLNFFEVTEFCKLVKSTRFLIKFVKTEFESSDSSATENKEFLKNISKSLK